VFLTIAAAIRCTVNIDLLSVDSIRVSVIVSSATNNRRWEAYVFGSAVRSSVRPCVVRPLTPILRDSMSLYIVEGFQLNLAQVINMWVVIVENVFKVRVQTRRSQRGR